ncbi:MAG: CBS domain-containing protein [Steroidobacteraceae bacterium]|jgi:CBS domain-containing protein
MEVRALCRRQPVTIDPRADLVDAARLMREHHVGILVVSDGSDPLGVITDRDIVLESVAADLSPHEIRVGDAMTLEPVTLAADSPVDVAIESLRLAGVRRAPVLDADGTLCGVVSMDDILEHLAGQLGALAGSVRHEQAIERLVRP